MTSQLAFLVRDCRSYTICMGFVFLTYTQYCTVVLTVKAGVRGARQTSIKYTGLKFLSGPALLLEGPRVQAEKRFEIVASFCGLHLKFVEKNSWRPLFCLYLKFGRKIGEDILFDLYFLFVFALY